MKKVIGVIFILSLVLSGCFLYTLSRLSPGTHGSIKGYQYASSKYELEKAVLQIIKTNPAISWNSSDASYYNDRKSYLTIKIKKADVENEYVFRYYGGEDYWNESKSSSEIFICYAYDKYGNGGSSGRGDFTWWHNRRLKNKMTNLFEEELVTKIDEVLGLKHEDDK